MSFRTRYVLCSIAAASLLTLGGGTAQAAIVTGPNNCPFQPSYAWMGNADAADVSIPSQTQPNGITSYRGTILRPADEQAYPGLRPLVVLQHGLGGSQCGLWWAAQDLAGHGYVALVWTSPMEDSVVGSFLNAADAQRSAIAFARSASNPFGASTDGDRVALGGHSLGSVTTSLLQGTEDPGVRAAVAYDSLRRWVQGDPGGAREECIAQKGAEVVPRVPAIGFAMDLPCSAAPTFAPADLKMSGFLHWRAAEVPGMQLTMAGFDHGDFSVGGNEAQWHDLSHFTRAWLDRWLLGKKEAVDRLLAPEVNGRPTEQALSTQFLSGAYLGERIDTADYRAVLLDEKGPKVKLLRSPAPRISRDVARKRGLRFKFEAKEENVRLECRLDDGRYRQCSSPQVYKRAALGRHTFLVRAIDEGDNRGKPATSKFRVVRAD